jgi:hypothetical protein
MTWHRRDTVCESPQICEFVTLSEMYLRTLLSGN